MTSVLFPLSKPLSLDYSQQSLETYFKERAKLKLVEDWKTETLEELFTRKLSYHLVLGAKMAGKSTVAKYLAKKMGWVLIEWIYESKVSLREIIEGTAAEMLSLNKNCIVDGFPQNSKEGSFLFTALGVLPQTIIFVDCKEDTLAQRFTQVYEIEGKELEAIMAEERNKAAAMKRNLERFCDLHRVRVLKIESEKELGRDPMMSLFLPKVVLVLHNQCEVILTNLSI